MNKDYNNFVERMGSFYGEIDIENKDLKPKATEKKGSDYIHHKNEIKSKWRIKRGNQQ